MKEGFGVVFVSAVIALALALPIVGRAQTRTIEVAISSINDSLITLPDDFIIPSSLALKLDNTIDLRSPSDFSLDTNLRFIVLTPLLRNTVFGVAVGSMEKLPSHVLQIRYSVLPINLKRSYTLYPLPNQKIDSVRIQHIDSSHQPLSVEQNPQQQRELALTKSGGITRGISGGSTQDIAFTNSFNLTFAGDLGTELSFKGALSEESTPIQPEGNTQILRDVDRIYLEINAGKIFAATLGDYTLDLNPKLRVLANTNSEYDQIFAKFTRKVLGAKADVLAGPTEIIVSGSATKGRFSTLAFAGLDGVQGPYRLQGKNGERNIIIVAGTEHVFIDGSQLMRGELNDYVIDYGLSEIRFTNKRFISSQSRITIDFEYTDEQYSRSLVATSQTSSFFDDKIRLSTSYIREGDDKDNPKILLLSDSDKTILQRAGSDPLKAGKSGVIFIGRDSSGRAKGNYIKVDSLITGIERIFFRYAPYDTAASLYNVSFGFSGSGKGAYIRNGIGEYSFVGSGLGDYDTTMYFPLPTRSQLFATQLVVRPISPLIIGSEFALSDFNANLFALPNGIQDNAYRIFGSFHDTIGRAVMSVHYAERFTGSQFNPIDRDRKVEELRNYGIDQSANSAVGLPLAERERKVSTSLGLTPLSLGVDYGLFTRGRDQYKAERFAGYMTLTEDTAFFPRTQVTFAKINTTDSVTLSNSVWSTITGSIKKSFIQGLLRLTPCFMFETNSRQANLIGVNDSLIATSFRFHQLTPSVDVVIGNNIAFGLQLQLRSDDSATSGAFAHTSDATTILFNSRLTNLSGFSSQLDLGVRKKNYADSVSTTRNGGNASSFLMRWIPRYQSANNILSIDGLYEASEQRAARVERIFFPVQKGLGSYRYLGDLNGNGKQDPEEFALARYSDEGAFILLNIPTEALFPVTDLRSSLRLRLSPLNYLSTETSVRIEENSSDAHTSDIYLYKLSHFLNDSTTLRGTIELQQDVNVLENNATQNYRLRYQERKNLVQYNTGPEKSYLRELSLRGRFHLSYEIGNETELTQTIDNLTADTHSLGQTHSTKRIDVRSEWNYEPYISPFGFTLTGEISSATDHTPAPVTNAFLNSLSLGIRYRISNSTRLRFELGRDELRLSGGSTSFTNVYSLTQGRNPGSTWLWGISFDLQLASGIVLTSVYNGRSELSFDATRNVIHTARAEVRASF